VRGALLVLVELRGELRRRLAAVAVERVLVVRALERARTWGAALATTIATSVA
jgi:hypothetical protein